MMMMTAGTMLRGRFRHV